MLLLFKLGFEFFQSCPKPGLDGTQRHPGDLSNLPQGQLLTEPEQRGGVYQIGSADLLVEIQISVNPLKSRFLAGKLRRDILDG